MSAPVAAIVADFRGAAKPDRQIKILSDIYQRSPYEIACILRDAGVLPDSINPDGFSVKFRPVAAAKDKKKATPAKPPAATPAKTRKKTKRINAPKPIDETRFMELYRQGLSDNTIAEALSCSDSHVQRFRRKLGLASNYIRGKRREKTMEETTANDTQPKDSDATAQRTTEAPRADEGMSVRRFCSVLMEILTPEMQQAALCINGAPVLDILSVVMQAVGDAPVVNVIFDGGGAP